MRASGRTDRRLNLFQRPRFRPVFLDVRQDQIVIVYTYGVQVSGCPCAPCGQVLFRAYQQCGPLLPEGRGGQGPLFYTQWDYALVICALLKTEQDVKWTAPSMDGSRPFSHSFRIRWCQTSQSRSHRRTVPPAWAGEWCLSPSCRTIAPISTGNDSSFVFTSRSRLLTPL